MKLICHCVLVTAVCASFVVPVFSSDPAEARKRLIERSGGGVGVITPNQKGSQTTTVYITALSPLREWISSDGRRMQGRLLAFSAPKPGEKGKVIVLKEGKVRMLRSGMRVPSDILLSMLSAEDQKFVLKIAAEAAKGPPPQTEKPAEK